MTLFESEVTQQIVMSFPFVDCSQKKAYKRGDHGHPRGIPPLFLRLPDSTAYITVMGSKRLTKSSLAQMRNPDLVIDLKKEKTNNENSDAEVVINDCPLVM